MRNEDNAVDEALNSLAGRQWTQQSHRDKLEEELMRGFDMNVQHTRMARHRLWVGGLAILVLGSVGFAAAGGIQMVRGWFVTVEVNGEVVDRLEVTPTVDEDGVATIVLPMPPSAESGGAVTVTLDADASPDGEGEFKTINVSLDGGDATIKVKSGDSPDGLKPEAGSDSEKGGE